MTACKLCTESKPLCKSHIIPYAVFCDAKPAGQGLNLVTTGRIEKNKFGGEYERLLCRDCEGRLGRYDEYGIRFLRGDEGEVIPVLDGKMIPSDRFDLRSGVDLKKLRLFVIAVLWRASVSSRPFYQHVVLGSYEDTARDILWEDRLLGDDDFPFVILQYTEPYARQVIIAPDKMHMDGRNAYNLNMCGHNFMVKVDSQPFADSLGILYRMLNDRGLVLVIKKSLYQSPELGELLDLVRRATKGEHATDPPDGRSRKG